MARRMQQQQMRPSRVHGLKDGRRVLKNGMKHSWPRVSHRFLKPVLMLLLLQRQLETGTLRVSHRFLKPVLENQRQLEKYRFLKPVLENLANQRQLEMIHAKMSRC